ncbi:A disintegrin and metalloproteinase with thrombospondin motifs like [Ornithodoros turicata]|uniref:A disintegrin and metalloproteinase with thrombospondin motifs like n=1 Tax=Ornithodoros turicata TaxID=34597 RepID=UPI00313A38AF
MHTLVIVTALVRLATAFQASFQESVVFPHLLEERSQNGEKVLRLNGELTLNLKQKSAYPDTLLLRTNENDGTTKERYINLRYTSVESPRVTIVIVGFTFNVQQEPYIRGFRNYAQYIDISSTLATLRDTYNLKSAFTNTVDLIFLISGLDLCGTANGLIECKIGGMAYLAGACTAHKYGVVEDKPRSYDVVRMMAHELGHSLGCVHDGEGPDSLMAGHPGASLCLWDYGYMMSYVQKDNNQYKFSPCCSQQIQFVSLQHTHGCLYKNDSGKTAATSPYLPGTNTTLDQLCHKSFGQDGLRYKFDTTRVPAGCQIPCISEKYMDGAMIRWKYGTATALDGSICDINDLSKICRNGECVHAVGYTQGAQPPPPIPTTQQPILPVATQRPEAGTTTRNLRIQWVYHWYPHLGWRLVPQYVAQ